MVSKPKPYDYSKSNQIKPSYALYCWVNDLYGNTVDVKKYLAKNSVQYDAIELGL